MWDTPTPFEDEFPEAAETLQWVYRTNQRTLLKMDQRISNKIGRNQPCPCSSGRKYKKCCGR